MSVELAVISCPRCLRQYETEASGSGQLGKCAFCKAHFSIAITELSARSDGAIVFDNPLTQRHNLLLDGCGTLAWNIRRLLKLAEQPVTPEAVAAIANTIPRSVNDLTTNRWRDGRCSRTLEQACNLTAGTPKETAWKATFEYFTGYVADRHFDVIDMLSGAFVGVLGEMEFDTPVELPTKKGRWFSRIWRVMQR